MKKLLLTLTILGGVGFFGMTTFASTAVPWSIKNITDQLFAPSPINGVNKGVLIGTTTIPADLISNDILRIQNQVNDFIDAGIENNSTGPCATAEFDALNSLTTLSNHFSAFGQTGGAFTGIGCSNVPYTGFPADSTYIVNPNGDIDFALGTTSSAGQFKWFTQGYAQNNLKMILTEGGFLGIGSTTPDSPITISNNLTSYAAPQTGTQLHIVENGVNARITLDSYNSGNTNGSIYQGRTAGGTNIAPTRPDLNETLVGLGGDGFGTTKFTGNSLGGVFFKVESTPFTDTSKATYLNFLTSGTTTTTGTERMRITSTGNVGIGTTTPLSPLTIAQTTTGNGVTGVLVDGALANANADIGLNRGNTGTTEANLDFNTQGVLQWQLGLNNNSSNDFELWDGSDNPALAINHSTRVVNVTTGFTSFASSTIGDGTKGGGLTISGGATSTSGFVMTAGQMFIATTTSAAAVSSDPLVVQCSAAECAYYGNGNNSSAWISLNSRGYQGYSASTQFNGYQVVQGTNAKGVLLASNSNSFATGITPTDAVVLQPTGLFGIGSTSPFAKLSIHANNGDTFSNNILFAIGSSTQSATTTVFSINNIGAFTAFNDANDQLAWTGSTLNILGQGSGSSLAVTYSGTTNHAASFTSTANNSSSVTITGFETSLGTLKVQHEQTAGDSGAAALSLDTAGANTATQILYLDSTGSTTGNIITGRNNTIERFTFDQNGWLDIGPNAPTAQLTVEGAAKISATLTLSALTGTQCLHEISGVVSGTGSDCSSGGGSTFPFTPNSWGNSTSTVLGFPGFISTGSSTLSSLGTGGLAVNNGLIYNAATTTFSSGLTYLNGNVTNTGVTSIVAGSNITISGATGAVTINASGSGGSAYPFTPSTDGGINTSATSTPIQGTNPGLGLDVSNTSWYGIGGQLLAYASTTNNTTIFGLSAGGNNATTSSTVTGTTAIGYQALQSLTTGTQNTAIGFSALTAVTTSPENTAIGYQALKAITTGASGNNVGVGYEAGNALTGVQNTVIGAQAMLNSSSVNRNTVIGYTAASSMSGSDNTMIGYQAGNTATALTNTVAIGDNTLNGATTGAGNIAIGFNTADQAITTDGSILIGYGINTPSVSTAGILNIGNVLFGLNMHNSSTATAAPQSNGIIGVGSTSPFAKLSIQANNLDTNTTLFAIGSSTQSATTTLFAVSNTGNVGIGIANPTNPLDIYSGANQYFSVLPPAGTYTGALVVRPAGSSGGAIVKASTLLVESDNLQLTAQSGAPFAVFSGGGTSVNFLNVIGGTTGNGLTLGSSNAGGDANVNINLLPKGNGAVGVSTTSPFGEFAIQANNGTNYTGNNLFAIGSSTQSATTTLFSVLNTGFANIGGQTSNAALVATDGRILQAEGGDIFFGNENNTLSITEWRRNASNLGGISTSNANFNIGSNNGINNSGSNAITITGASANPAFAIGSTTPSTLFAKFSINTQTGDAGFGYIFALASSTLTGTTTPFAVSSGGWVVTSGTLPTASSCGSTNNVSGNQTNGTVMFTGTLVTSCTVTFPQPVPPGTTLQCTESDNSLAATADISATTTSSVTFGLSTGLAAGAITWNCGASRNDNK